jgi:hypothetical protein
MDSGIAVLKGQRSERYWKDIDKLGYRFGMSFLELPGAKKHYLVDDDGFEHSKNLFRVSTLKSLSGSIQRSYMRPYSSKLKLEMFKCRSAKT